jgi:hypothetical protein
MLDFERVTVTLPHDLIKDIDRQETNRSRFIAEAVRHELDRRRRLELRRSLQNPHPENIELAEAGLSEWMHRLPDEDAEALVKPSVEKPIQWVPGEGWVERKPREPRRRVPLKNGP